MSDFIGKLAKGFAAAKAAIGSDAAGEERQLAMEHGGTLKVQPRIKRPEGRLMVRVETPLGEGLARLDLSPADARALATELIAFADNAAATQAKPIAVQRNPEE
jgi:hypothetical protein